MKLHRILVLAAALHAACSGPATAAQYDFDYNFTNAQGGKSPATVNLAPGAGVLGIDPAGGKFKRFTPAEFNELMGSLVIGPGGAQPYDSDLAIWATKTPPTGAAADTAGSYADPAWITSLAWGKIASRPTTLSGYGITDAMSGAASSTTNAFVKFSGSGGKTAANSQTTEDASGNVGVVGRLSVGQQVEFGVVTLSYAASVALDFAAANYASLALSGNVTITTSNLAAGRSKTVRIVADASSRTFTWPASWVWLGAGPPASISASKTGVLSLTAFGTTDSTVVAAYSEQP